MCVKADVGILLAIKCSNGDDIVKHTLSPQNYTNKLKNWQHKQVLDVDKCSRLGEAEAPTLDLLPLWSLRLLCQLQPLESPHNRARQQRKQLVQHKGKRGMLSGPNSLGKGKPLQIPASSQLRSVHSLENKMVYLELERTVMSFQTG